MLEDPASDTHTRSPAGSDRADPNSKKNVNEPSDKMERAINVALKLVTGDNNNVDPALRKKATDLLSSVLDQAMD
jgi:hypothetical protein